MSHPGRAGETEVLQPNIPPPWRRGPELHNPRVVRDGEAAAAGLLDQEGGLLVQVGQDRGLDSFDSASAVRAFQVQPSLAVSLGDG